jgi:hypothetical protein
MQDNPSKLELLRAVSILLKEDIRPAIEDKGLQFRALIAANLVRIVADEIENEESADHEEFSALLALLPDCLEDEELKGHHRKEAILRLRKALAEKIRNRSLENHPATFEFLKNNLKAKLEVVNPRFSTELEIE